MKAAARKDAIPLVLARPPGPVSQMTQAERRAFATAFVDAMFGRLAVARDAVDQERPEEADPEATPAATPAEGRPTVDGPGETGGRHA